MNRVPNHCLFLKFHFYLLQLPKKYVSKSIAQFFSSSSLNNIHKSILIGIECIIIAQMIFYQNRNHLFLYYVSHISQMKI